MTKHETDNEMHPNTLNMSPYVPKCFELTYINDVN